MSGKTAISWTNATWNPTVGCTRVSSGCDHCYAFTLHDMRHRAYQEGKQVPIQYAEPYDKIQLLPERLDWPLKQKKPLMIFVNSMSDLFHSHIPESFIRDVFAVMRQAHWHTFQVLTKRAGRLRRLGQTLDWAPNIWMGVSIENDLLTPRADALREINPAIRFLSCEPLLSALPSLNLDGLDWVIAGAESGQGMRPMDDNWVRSLRDRCTERNIAFFFKQRIENGRKVEHPILDGREWSEFPQKRETGLWDIA